MTVYCALITSKLEGIIFVKLLKILPIAVQTQYLLQNILRHQMNTSIHFTYLTYIFSCIRCVLQAAPAVCPVTLYLAIVTLWKIPSFFLKTCCATKITFYIEFRTLRIKTNACDTLAFV